MPKSRGGGTQMSDANSGELNEESVRMPILKETLFLCFIFIGHKSCWGCQDKENKFTRTVLNILCEVIISLPLGGT